MMNFKDPYCLIHRREKTFYAAGTISRIRLLADVPRPTNSLPVICMVPYAQLRERNLPVHDGGEEIITLMCKDYREIDLDQMVQPGWNASTVVEGSPSYNMSDDEFMEKVDAIVRNEICQGEGSNFLLSRKCQLSLANFDSHVANSIFIRYLHNEPGAYMTFCLYDGERYFIGASPERHISVEQGSVCMNPICGTLPKSVLQSRSDLVAFLSDPKEINELFQVVDEELKMMSRICSSGGRVLGPFLKEMSTLIHTEYLLIGKTEMDNIDAFRASMFAATMIGSPLENAARVIKKYESDSRRYYSSAILLLDLDGEGKECLDSAITIRTMEVDKEGKCTIQSGASIVRDSVPANECREINAKSAAAVNALRSNQKPMCQLEQFTDDRIQEVLISRNKFLSRFWIRKQSKSHTVSHLESKKLLIVDNEDEFAYMLKHALSHLGLRVVVKDFDDPTLDFARFDVVLIGPGPGDPTNLEDTKIRIAHEQVASLLSSQANFIAVCLGHQILCHHLGLKLINVDPPLQGVQRSIELYGRQENVGFYNTFFAVVPEKRLADIEISSEPDGTVMALRSAHFASYQFHVESVLTTNGLSLLREAVDWVTR